jgi:hypothetical protein
MSDGPGAPESPHNDPDPYDPRQRREPYRLGDGRNAPEERPPQWQPSPAGRGRPGGGWSGYPAQDPGYPAQDPGYGSGQAGGNAAVPPSQAPSSLGSLAGLRAAGDRRAVTSGRGVISRKPEPLKIGIWGSPQSGKTTFLAALSQAIHSSRPSFGRWDVVGLKEGSTRLLVNWTHQLVTEHRFPEVTAANAEIPLSWRFYGDMAGSRYLPPWRRLWRAPEPEIFDLDLIDVSGEVFGPNPAATPKAVVDRTLKHLAEAKGLIFLFDPIPGPETPGVEQYLNGPLAEIKRLVEGERRMVGGYLPHHISVCVTKFDDQRLFPQACLAGYVNSGRDGIPRVRDRHAKRLFESLCDGTFWPPDELGTPGPQFVRRMLQRSFHAARTRYYTTSAIGFRRDADGRFDHHDFANVREETDGNRIRGEINPINVLEPLVDMYMKLRMGRGAR